MMNQRKRSSIQKAISSKYFSANIYDKAVKALGGKLNPTPAQLREARRQIIAQMKEVVV